jgi:hypothetical protein
MGDCRLEYVESLVGKIRRAQQRNHWARVERSTVRNEWTAKGNKGTVGQASQDPPSTTSELSVKHSSEPQGNERAVRQAVEVNARAIQQAV